MNKSKQQVTTWSQKVASASTPNDAWNAEAHQKARDRERGISAEHGNDVPISQHPWSDALLAPATRPSGEPGGMGDLARSSLGDVAEPKVDMSGRASSDVAHAQRRWPSDPSRFIGLANALPPCALLSREAACEPEPPPPSAGSELACWREPAALGRPPEGRCRLGDDWRLPPKSVPPCALLSRLGARNKLKPPPPCAPPSAAGEETKRFLKVTPPWALLFRLGGALTGGDDVAQFHRLEKEPRRGMSDDPVVAAEPLGLRPPTTSLVGSAPFLTTGAMSSLSISADRSGPAACNASSARLGVAAVGSTTGGGLARRGACGDVWLWKLDRSGPVASYPACSASLARLGVAAVGSTTGGGLARRGACGDVWLWKLERSGPVASDHLEAMRVGRVRREKRGRWLVSSPLCQSQRREQHQRSGRFREPRSPGSSPRSALAAAKGMPTRVWLAAFVHRPHAAMIAAIEPYRPPRLLARTVGRV